MIGKIKRYIRKLTFRFLFKEGEFLIKYYLASMDGKKYFIPEYAIHRPAAQALLNGRLYEPETHEFVRFILNKYSGSMIHAGTFFGDMLPNFASYAGGCVYAFEPVLENYLLAALCVRENGLENVLLFNCCLGKDLGTLRINSISNEGDHAGGASHIAPIGDICLCMPLDELEFPQLSLIQLDVEGYEINALNGAVKTINQHRPIIAIEDNANDCDDLLGNLEYELLFKLPELKVWCPKESSLYKDDLNAFSKSHNLLP